MKAGYAHPILHTKTFNNADNVFGIAAFVVVIALVVANHRVRQRLEGVQARKSVVWIGGLPTFGNYNLCFYSASFFLFSEIELFDETQSGWPNDYSQDFDQEMRQNPEFMVS